MKDKALGKSISFRPGSLYDEAEAYGLQQRPTLNVSEVVCHFTRLGLDGAATSELQRLATELRRLGGDPIKTLEAAIDAQALYAAYPASVEHPDQIAETRKS